MIKNLAAAVVATCLLACGRGKDLSDDDRLQGVVELDERRLAFETGGKVVDVQVQRGDELLAGRELARLDDTLARSARDARAAELKAAEAGLALLRAGARKGDIRAAQAELAALRQRVVQLQRNADRARTLVAQGAQVKAVADDLADELARAREAVAAASQRLSVLQGGARPEDLEAASARVEAARAGLAAEEARLERMKLVSGAPGTVLEVYVDPGEVVAPGAPVVAVADTAHPFVDVFVPLAEAPKVRVGQAAGVRVDGVPEVVHGQVEHVSRTTEYTPRYVFSARERPHLVVRARVRIDDPGRLLRAGMPAFVELGEPTP